MVFSGGVQIFRLAFIVLQGWDGAGNRSELWVPVELDPSELVLNLDASPRLFSPNGDGVNDSFTVYGASDIERVESLQIFDRWGGLLYAVSDFLPGDGAPAWDGRIRNRNAPVGTYLYQVKVHFRDGSSQVRSGEVVLLR